MMKRWAEENLELWLKSGRRKPLILRGARQVGKSTLIQNFCADKGVDLVEVNLELTSIREFNKNEGFSLESAIQEMEVVTKKRIRPGCLLFIDEIQEQPEALSKLRYFFEKKPELPVIAAGSLLESALESMKSKVPVGRIEYLHLGPMKFSEFLYALDESVLLDQLKSFELNETAFEYLKKKLKEFYFVGGMPEAVLTYVQTKSFLEVRKVQSLLLQTYKEDLPKYTPAKQEENLLEVLNYVPIHIGHKVKYSNVSEAKSQITKKSIDLLCNAKLIHKIIHTNATSLPLTSLSDERVFKLYLLDIGLMNAMLDVEWTDLIGLNNEELVHSGAMAEQFIAQHLLYSGPSYLDPQLHYWLKDKNAHKAEIDFVVSVNSKIIPIEVKAGKSGVLKALKVFFNENKIVDEAIRFDLKYRESLSEKKEWYGRDLLLHNFPLFFVEFYEAFLAL